jgi:homoserine kinase type II
MAAITPLSEPDLEILLSKYGLEGLESYWPASNGIENSNYFVRLASRLGPQELVVTMLEQPANAGPLLVPLLDACDTAGLPVAPIIRNRFGAPSDHINGKPTIVAPRLIGRHVLNPTVRQCESVGRFLARFHKVTAPLGNTAAAHPRNEVWLVQRAESIRGYVPYVEFRLARDAVESIGSMLRRQDVKALPRGVIHGDLFRDNVLFTERGLTGVLDFHHAAAGYWIYDLAVAANDWCNDNSGVLDPDRTLALLRAYHAIRPLALAEIWYFPAFALYAATAFWLARLCVALRQDSGVLVRLKNPQEFRRIVEQHIAHFFYLDARLLD